MLNLKSLLFFVISFMFLDLYSMNEQCSVPAINYETAQADDDYGYYWDEEEEEMMREFSSLAVTPCCDDEVRNSSGLAVILEEKASRVKLKAPRRNEIQEKFSPAVFCCMQPRVDVSLSNQEAKVVGIKRQQSSDTSVYCNEDLSSDIGIYSLLQKKNKS